MKKQSTLLSFFLLSICLLWGQIPPQPSPQKLVNDLAHLFSQEEIDRLEKRLVAFNDSTSNVVCVVTVDDLNGLSAADFAYEIGDKWGVKDKKYNSGVVILIKPKNQTSGEVYIAVGYDLEAVLTDAKSKRIIETIMIPAFKQNDYYGGVEKAMDMILPLLAGEISDVRDLATSKRIFIFIVILFFMIFLFIAIIKKKKGGSAGNGNSAKQSDLWKWILLGSGNPGRGSSGNHRNVGGGGFGGFGGSGGFGGGGAGGKW